MRKCLVVVAALTVLCGLQACFAPEGGGEDLVKPPIVLQLTVKNNMDIPINIHIRHRYKKGFIEPSYEDVGIPYLDLKVSYSEWKAYDIPAGGGETLGDETAAWVEDGVEREWSGFVLLDDELNRNFKLAEVGGHTSFELEVRAGNTAIRLAGYESENESENLHFNETRLCDVRLEVASLSAVWREVLLLLPKPTENRFRLDEPTLLAASLSIQADGTYTFDMKRPFEPPEY